MKGLSNRTDLYSSRLGAHPQTTTPIDTAAAFVPFLSTSICALWIIASIINHSLDIGEKSACGVNSVVMPIFLKRAVISRSKSYLNSGIVTYTFMLCELSNILDRSKESMHSHHQLYFSMRTAFRDILKVDLHSQRLRFL